MTPATKGKFAPILIKVAELMPLALGFLVLLYSLSPFRIWEKFVLPNQIEIIVVVSYLAVFILGFLLFRFFKDTSIIKLAISNIDILLLVYVSYIGCRYLFQYKTINPEFVFEGFSLVVFYILFRNLSHKTTTCLLWIFPLAGLAQILYGIETQTDNFAPGYGLSDITGVFSNTGILGGFIAITTVATFGLAFRSLNPIISGFKRKLFRNGKALLFVVFSILSIQLVASNSRAAWCGCLAGALYLIGTHLGLRPKFVNLASFKKWAIAVLSLSLVALLLYGLYQYKKGSADGRILIWQVSSDMIKEMPLFGHGPGGFKANYMEYQAAYFASNPESPLSYLADDNFYAFNEFIRIWVEQGAVVLLLSVLLLYFLFFGNKSEGLNEDWATITAKSSLLAILVFGLFSYPTEVFQFNVMAVFFVAILSKRSPAIKYIIIEPASENQKSLKWALKIGVAVLWLAVALEITTLGYDYATACKKWDSALKGFSETNPANSIAMLEKVCPRLKNNGIFLTTYGKVLTLSRQYNKAIEALQRANCHLPSAANYTELGKCYRETGDPEHAEAAWAKASYMMPSQFTPKYLTAKMYFENGKTAESQQIARELLNKDIKIWSPGLQNILDELKELLKTTDKTKITDIIYPK